MTVRVVTVLMPIDRVSVGAVPVGAVPVGRGGSTKIGAVDGSVAIGELNRHVDVL